MLSRQEKVALLRSRLDGGAGARDSGLTSAQARLWDLEEQIGTSAMHVFALAYHLDGPIDVQLLAESIAAVAERHPALRARVAVAEGQPRFEPVAPPSLVLRSITCGESKACPITSRRVCLV